MNSLVVVVFLTFQRTTYALRTIRSTLENLVYDNLLWYVADDGSAQAHVDQMLAEIPKEKLLGWHTIAEGTYGANANKAWHAAHEKADLTLWLEDDWEMQRRLELALYVRALENDSIGMIRMGYLNLGMAGKTIGLNGNLYWVLDRDADPYVFTGHPALRHRRFREAYGAYPEGLQPGETELAYATQYRLGKGPEIVWPVCLGEYGPWGHIGTIKSYE